MGDDRAYSVTHCAEFYCFCVYHVAVSAWHFTACFWHVSMYMTYTSFSFEQDCWYHASLVLLKMLCNCNFCNMQKCEHEFTNLPVHWVLQWVPISVVKKWVSDPEKIEVFGDTMVFRHIVSALWIVWWVDDLKRSMLKLFDDVYRVENRCAGRPGVLVDCICLSVFLCGTRDDLKARWYRYDSGRSAWVAVSRSTNVVL